MALGNSEDKMDSLSRLHHSPNLQSLQVSKNEDSEFIGMRDQSKKVSPDDFVAHSVLGKGSFGEVYLVQKKDQSEF